jgi:hypothetical protein
MSQARKETDSGSQIKCNTLLGESAGEKMRKLAREEYRKFAKSSLEGSLEDGNRRSRSRSKKS